METAINKAIEFSKVQPEKKDFEHAHAKTEKPKIFAVVIIGLKSGERIMKDVFSQDELTEELLKIQMLSDDEDNYFLDYYFNGQRHIIVYKIVKNQIESISYTETENYRI